MSWSDFYLICFLVGLGLSALSFLSGSLHLHHIPLHHGAHGGHGAHAAHGTAQISPFNFGTITAFLAWFGGAGYLMTRYYGMWLALTLAIAVLSGLTGASVVFWFIAKVLLAREKNLDPADYEMTGVLGRVSSSIRKDGTGEMIFSQNGCRRVAGARSEDKTAIPKGTEVVVTKYEKGIAYVRRWEDLK